MKKLYERAYVFFKISVDDIHRIYVYLFSDFLFARAILRAKVCDSLCVR